MTNEQINSAIAEACGWRDLTYTGLGQSLQRWMGRKNKHEALRDTPNYCDDLNAMHEAERTLACSLQSAYIYELWDVTGSKVLGAFENITATARQRAEAFLRTLGKWEEGE